MSFVTDFVSDIFGGGDAADAATEAADIQSSATVQAANIQAQGLQDVLAANQQALDTSRADLQPFRDAGIRGLQAVAPLINDPQAQADYIQNNPFLDALASDAERRIFNTQGARGKAFSGGTAQALQNSLMLLGPDLIDRQVSRGLNLATLGQNAAAGQAAASQNIGSQNAGAYSANAANIGNLITQGANAQASGVVGAANAQQGALNSAINTGLGVGALFALSDPRYKTDIKYLTDIGFPVYFFKYKGSNKIEIGTMADGNNSIDFGGKRYVDYGKLLCQ